MNTHKLKEVTYEGAKRCNIPKRRYFCAEKIERGSVSEECCRLSKEKMESLKVLERITPSLTQSTLSPHQRNFRFIFSDSTELFITY